MWYQRRTIMNNYNIYEIERIFYHLLNINFESVRPQIISNDFFFVKKSLWSISLQDSQIYRKDFEELFPHCPEESKEIRGDIPA